MQSTMKSMIVLAQNTGGQGGEQITQTIDNATSWLTTAGISITGAAAVIAVVIAGVTISRGGNLQSAFSKVSIPLLAAFALGIVATAVGWFNDLGSNIAGS